MRTSESIQNIAKALAAAQGKIKNPEANEVVEVHAKREAGGGLLYSYKYATLPKCFDAVRAPFAEFGLSHTAAVVLGDKGADLVVRLVHESGEFYETSVPLQGGGDAKARAGEITFWKRYLFNGLAGLAGDDDIRTADGDAGPESAAPKGAAKAPAPKAAPKPAPEKKAAPEPGTFAASDGPNLKRPRGVIVREIMTIAGQLGLGGPGKDPMIELARVGQEMFQRPLEKITDAELEKMLGKLTNDLKGK